MLEEEDEDEVIVLPALVVDDVELELSATDEPLVLEELLDEELLLLDDEKLLKTEELLVEVALLDGEELLAEEEDVEDGDVTVLVTAGVVELVLEDWLGTLALLATAIACNTDPSTHEEDGVV